MKIRKMIEVLENCQEKYGNVEVFMCFDPKEDAVEVSNVIPVFAYGHFKRLEIFGSQKPETEK